MVHCRTLLRMSHLLYRYMQVGKTKITSYLKGYTSETLPADLYDSKDLQLKSLKDFRPGCCGILSPAGFLAVFEKRI